MNAGRRCIRGVRCSDQGFAILSVLIVTALIATFAIGLLAWLRTITNEEAKINADAPMRAVLEAALNRMIVAYGSRNDPLRTLLVPDGRAVRWVFDGRAIILRTEAESGKIDLNAGDRAHIVALASRVIKDANALRRFIEGVDAARQNRQRIHSPAALLSTLDRMTSRRDEIESCFTIATDQRGINPNTAPRIVLETLPQMVPEAVDTVLRGRMAGQPIPFDVVADVARQMFVPERPIYTFRAQTAESKGRVGALRAVVSFPEQGAPVIHAWSSVGTVPNEVSAIEYRDPPPEHSRR